MTTNQAHQSFEAIAVDQLDGVAGGWGYFGNPYGGPGFFGGYGYGGGSPPAAGYEWQNKTYTVKPGDNLTEIGQHAGDSLNKILRLNPQYRANPNLIYPGQHVVTGRDRVPVYL
jgi:hypothetical protein